MSSSWLFSAFLHVPAPRTHVALAMHQPGRSSTFSRDVGYANVISLRSIETSSGSVSGVAGERGPRLFQCLNHGSVGGLYRDAFGGEDASPAGSAERVV